MSKIRAMVIDDSAFMRKVITNLLQEKGTIEVIATARNGKDALTQLDSLTPDVITLDVEMPIMNGLEFLSIMMKQKRIPTVMLSSLTSEGATETLHALELGAVDFITKPSGSISLDIDKLQTEIIEKVQNAAGIDMNKMKHEFSAEKITPSVHIKRTTQNFPKQIQEIVAIGTSTGGPRALQEVLTKIPADFPAPILIVQHMPPGFTKSLADRLHSICQIEVREATHLEQVRPGVAYIAPGNNHMYVEVQDGYLHIHLDQNTPPRGGHRPAVDVLFESIATIEKVHKYIVIMTGMGSDGSRGLQKIREKSSRDVVAIAEDESTCVVYGMPRAAVQLGLIDHSVQLDRIGDELTRLLFQKK